MDAGCAADESADLADGEVVWSWRLDAGVKLRGSVREVTVTRKPDHRGEHEISCNTIACGNAGRSGATVVTNARATNSTRAAAGASGTRHSPLPFLG